jgi:anti-anti-sigma factor
MAGIEVRREGESAVVRPEGDLVAAKAAPIREAMRELVRSGVRRLELDVSRAAMIDSTGLGLLLSAFNSMKAAGGAFSVTGASAEILDLFRTMRLHQHFPVSGVETAEAGDSREAPAAAVKN